jgi:hypothetical protein
MFHMNSLYMHCCSDKSGTNLIKVYAKLREITLKEKQRKIRMSVRTEEGCVHVHVLLLPRPDTYTHIPSL